MNNKHNCGARKFNYVARNFAITLVTTINLYAYLKNIQHKKIDTLFHWHQKLLCPIRRPSLMDSYSLGVSAMCSHASEIAVGSLLARFLQEWTAHAIL